MHVRAADQVSMAGEAALLALPHAAFRLVAVAALRTPAGRPTFVAGEARNTRPLGLVSEIGDVFTDLPLGDPLVMMASAFLGADAAGIANEKRSDMIGGAKIDDFSRRLVTLVLDAPLGEQAAFLPGVLELSPAARSLYASRSLGGDFAHLLVQQMLVGADAATGNDEGFAIVGDDRSEMNFAEVGAGAVIAWRRLGLDDVVAHDVKLVAFIPDELYAARFEIQLNLEGQGFAAAAHWQDEASGSGVVGDGLFRPIQREEGLFAIGISEPALRARLGTPALRCRLDIAEKLVADHLDGL